MPSSTRISERKLPHDLEIEKAVLGSILLFNDGYSRVAPLLNQADFFRVGHGIVWKAITDALERPGGAIDIASLRSELARVGKLDDAGGVSYVSSLIDTIGRGANLTEYATVLREKSRLRALILMANKTATSAYEQESSDDIVGNLDNAIVSLRYRSNGSTLVPMRQSVADLRADMALRQHLQGDISGVDTGYAALNSVTMGWQPGDLIVVAARPSCGKTALVLNLAAHAALRHDGCIPIFSLEMKRTMLLYRMASMRSGIPLTLIRRGMLDQDQQLCVEQAIEELETMGIWIDDEADQTMRHIRASCKQLRAERPLVMIVVDYLQLITPDLAEKNASRAEKVADISRKLKKLAKEFDVPVIALAQLSRAQEGKPDKTGKRPPTPRPRLSDLRESGAIEQDADVVLFIHGESHRRSGMKEIILEKQRNEDTATIKLDFDREVQRFNPHIEPAPKAEESVRQPTPSKKPSKKQQERLQATEDEEDPI